MRPWRRRSPTSRTRDSASWFRTLAAQPPQAVEVETNGAWYPGVLRDWRRVDRTWEALTCYADGQGLRLLEWVAPDRVRQCSD